MLVMEMNGSKSEIFGDYNKHKMNRRMIIGVVFLFIVILSLCIALAVVATKYHHVKDNDSSSSSESSSSSSSLNQGSERNCFELTPEGSSGRNLDIAKCVLGNYPLIDGYVTFV